MQRSRAVEWLQGGLIKAEVDLRDDRELVVLRVDALNLSVIAQALLDGLVDGLQCVLLRLRGHNVGVGQPLVEVRLLEGGQGGLEVAQLVLHHRRLDGAGAVFLVLVRPELTVRTAHLQ